MSKLARKSYSSAKQSSSRAEERFNRAVRCHLQGDLAQAESNYRETLAAEANHVGALHLLGVAMVQMGRPAMGVELIDRALTIKPDYVDAYSNRGNALKDLKRLDEALLSFDAALAIRADYADAHNNRGAALKVLGRLDEALASFDRALLVQRDHADALCNRGAALIGLNRFEDALASYDKALAIRPNHAETFCNRGAALDGLNRREEALASYDRALAIRPDYVEANGNRGVVLQKLGKLEGALASFDKALMIRPDYADGLNNRGNALRALKRLDEAIASYDKALEIGPDNADVHNNRGAALRDLNRPDEALASYDRALAIRRDSAEAFCHRGSVLQELNRFDEALASYAKALAIKPDYADALYNRGNALEALDRPDEALASYDAALAIRPENADALNNRGNALKELKRIGEALASYDRALAIAPDFADAVYNRGLAALLDGDLAAGWRDGESRWEGKERRKRKLEASYPVWRGEDLFGKTIVVYEEQGLGDIIQFSRYLKPLCKLGAKVTFYLRREMHRLLSHIDTAVSLTDVIAEPRTFDYQCALLSLPLAFATTLDNIPAETPYLRAEPERVQKWRRRLGERGFKIGVAWQGNKAAKIDRGRSVPLAHFFTLSQIPDVRLISLQKNDGVEQLGDLPQGMKVETLGDDYDAGDDAFVDAAAVMEALDLVISSDTAIAHLAGALGRPVWVALKYVADWRWLLDRTDTPWHPTMRLFRQRTRGDWREPFAEMETALRNLLDNRRRTLAPLG